MSGGSTPRHAQTAGDLDFEGVEAYISKILSMHKHEPFQKKLKLERIEGEKAFLVNCGQSVLIRS